jgi:hypothetical protein
MCSYPFSRCPLERAVLGGGARYEIPPMFGFIVLPITFLGGTHCSWTKLAPITVGGWRWLQAVVLINPLICNDL